jgi:hypothetical protein
MAGRPVGHAHKKRDAQVGDINISPFTCMGLARHRARELANTPAFASAQRERKKVEALFAELKNLIGLRRLRLRRMKFVRERFLPCSGGPEPQATGAIPQPTDYTQCWQPPLVS